MTVTGSQYLEKSGSKAPYGEGTIAIIRMTEALAQGEDTQQNFVSQGNLPYHFQVRILLAMRFVTNLKISHE